MTARFEAPQLVAVICAVIMLGLVGMHVNAGAVTPSGRATSPEAPMPQLAAAGGPIDAELPQPVVVAAAVPAVAGESAALPALPHGPHARMMWMEVTAYCACKKCCGPNAQGITASGKRVSYNDGKFVAADTNVLPFGTRVMVPGYHDGQPVEVIDRGGAIKGNKLDLYFHSHQEAMEWGRKWMLVTVVE